MHEYSIVHALLARVEHEARARQASAVVRLRVKIGALSGVEPELLARAYEIFRERTVCERAELCIEPIPELWACSACAAPIEQGASLVCQCCRMPARLAQGDEIILERIEMEVP